MSKIFLAAFRESTPTVSQCIREDLDCTCAVHGYKLFAEFDYFCDICESSENADFHSSPRNVGLREEQPCRHIKPERTGFGAET